MWPACWLDGDEGTVYIAGKRFREVMERHGYGGQAWSHHRHWTTYRPNGRIIYKNIARLSPRSEADFWDIMETCQGNGMQPPTSFGDCFLSVFRHPFPRKSVIAPLRGKSWGGWEAAPRVGRYHGPVWWYDLRKAYRWAACQGLPDLRTAYWIDEGPREGATYAIYRVLLPLGSLPYIRTWQPVWITCEELERSQKRPEVFYGGLGFRSFVDLRGVFSLIDINFPYCRDRISRAFWGLWNAVDGPDQWSWRSGAKTRRLPNPFYNPIWALVVTSRVKLRVLEHWPYALHVFVDSVLLTKEIETGPDIGDWRLERMLRGVTIKAPGYWGDDAGPIKHSGVKG